jgi:iron complex outermembrane recepter protein
MKKFILFFIVFLFNLFAYSKVLVLSGKVIDASTKQPMVGAAVSIPDLRISAVTDEKGEFFFRNTPVRGRFLVEVKFIGYKTITQTVDLSALASVHFAMHPSVIEAHEVVITGTALSSDNSKNSTNVMSVRREELINRPASNLIDALSRTAGISQVTTGAGVSKPVIRGLSYNRVVTLIDGAKQEGQQWGDEHGIEADMFNTGRVEILHGPASLLYGSDAIGGVINVLEPLSPVEGQIRGELLSNYASNNGLTSNSAMIEGNTNGFVWRGRASYKNAFGYNTPRGRIANSGFNETNFNSLLGLNKKWGYAHLNISSFKNDVGLPGHQHEDHEEAGQDEENAHADDFITHSKERRLDLPFQDVRHYKVALNSNVLLGEGRLRTTLAYQNNQRRELEESFSDPSLFFELKTYSYDLKYYLPGKKGWEPAIGISGSFQDNVNKAEEKLIPNYNARDFGAFAYLKKSWTNSSFNFGLRYDYKDIEGFQMEEDALPKFSNFNNDFSNLTGAIGFTHEFSEGLNIKANLGTAFRAPNIAELSSDGVHEGTFRYEIGNANLKPEKSYYGDIALEYDTDKLHAAVSAFNNYIDHYIYYRQIDGETRAIGEELIPVFRYVQDNANLYGAEASFTYHPVELIHFDNSFSYVVGKNRGTKTPLPFIPAARLRNELRFEPDFENKKLKGAYFSIELNNVFKQAKIDNFETSTNGYTLVNFAIGATVKLKQQPVMINIAGNNILNKAYVDHLSRLKYEGILNQGRNISLGIRVPIIITQ